VGVDLRILDSILIRDVPCYKLLLFKELKIFFYKISFYLVLPPYFPYLLTTFLKDVRLSWPVLGYGRQHNVFILSYLRFTVFSLLIYYFFVGCQAELSLAKSYVFCFLTYYFIEGCQAELTLAKAASCCLTYVFSLLTTFSKNVMLCWPWLSLTYVFSLLAHYFFSKDVRLSWPWLRPPVLRLRHCTILRVQMYC